MSKITTFVPLTKLRPFKDNWRVQVKCLHSWKQNSPFVGDTFEMVLADEWVSSIKHVCSSYFVTNVSKVSSKANDLDAGLC